MKLKLAASVLLTLISTSFIIPSQSMANPSASSSTSPTFVDNNGSLQLAAPSTGAQGTAGANNPRVPNPAAITAPPQGASPAVTTTSPPADTTPSAAPQGQPASGNADSQFSSPEDGSTSDTNSGKGVSQASPDNSAPVPGHTSQGLQPANPNSDGG